MLRTMLHRHEVRGDRDAGRELVQQVALGGEAVQQRVGAEAEEVQLLGRVGERRRRARRQDLVPVAVVLAPERGAPRLVERVERRRSASRSQSRNAAALTRRSSSARCARRARCPRATSPAPGGRGNRSASAVTRASARSRKTGELGHHACRPPGQSTVPSAVRGSDLGVRRGQPGRRRGGGGGQVDARCRPRAAGPWPRSSQSKLEASLLRLEQRPGEDADGDQVDAGLAHQPDVLGPGLARPLLGVVVAAERESPASAAGGARQSWLGHCGQAAGQSQQKPTRHRGVDPRAPAPRPLRRCLIRGSRMRVERSNSR